VKHETTVRDVTATRGYGPYGHGTYLVTCTCGWYQYSYLRGRNGAEYVVAYEHRMSKVVKP
jgi:hypothetical protein